MNDVTIIDRFLDTFSRYIDSGFGLLQGEVAFLTATLIVIDMTIAGLYWAMSHATGQGDDVIAKLLRKVLCVGAFAYIIGNFNWLASIVFRSFAGLGITATGSAITMENFLQPGRLAKTGIDAAAPILEQIGDMAGFPEVFVNIDPIVVLFIAWLVVILCFFVLAVQLFITLIEFKLTTLAGFVLIPFALWNKTSFLAEKVLGNVVSSGIKVLVLAVIVGIGSGLFAEFGASRRTIHRPRAGRDAGLARAAGAGHFRPRYRHRPGVRCATAWCGRDGWCCGRGCRHRRCHRRRRNGRGRRRHGRGTNGPGGRKAGRCRCACRDFGGRQCPIGVRGRFRCGRRRCQGRGGWPRQCRQDWRTSRRPQRHLWCFRCWAEGGRLLPRWLERHRSRQRRCWPRPDRRRHRRLAEATATGLGQADAPPPAGYPCRDHCRPHAARRRRRRLGQGPSLRDSDT